MLRSSCFFIFFYLFNTSLAHSQIFKAVLSTDSGAPLKIIAKNATARFEKPNRDSKSSPVEAMDFFYVLPADENKNKLKNGFYKVSTDIQGDSFAGWVAESDVLEWPHRQLIGFRDSGNRQKAHFYKSIEDLRRDYLSGKQNPEFAISRETSGNISKNLLIPIIAEKTPIINNQKIRCFEVAYLHGNVSSSSGLDSDAMPSIEALKRNSTLDFAIVVDATKSMNQWIAGVKKAIVELSKRLANTDGVRPRLRFALVAFRDREDEFVAKVVHPFTAATDVDSFVKSLEGLETAGGGDQSEQGFLGIKVAINELMWAKVGFRHLLVVGDAPFHDGPPSGDSSHDEVMRLAQPENLPISSGKHITIHTLLVGKDNDAAKKQFLRLSEGRNGLRGLSSSFKDVDSFSKEIIELMQRPTEAIQKVITGKVDEVISSKDPILKGMIEQLKAANYLDSPNHSSFSKGYVGVMDPDGRQMLDTYILVSHGQLDQRVSAINFIVSTLKNSGDSGAKDIDKAFSRLQVMSTNLNLGEDFSENTPLDKILEMRDGLPVKTRMLKMSIRQIVAMNQSEFSAWVSEIAVASKMIKNRLDDPAGWFSLGGEKRSDRRQCFIKLSDLP